MCVSIFGILCIHPIAVKTLTVHSKNNVYCGRCTYRFAVDFEISFVLSVSPHFKHAYKIDNL